MSKLTWDNVGEHFYETGVSHAAVYIVQPDGTYANGFAWNGITSISENPEGAETTDVYADNIKYLSMRSVEKYGATIEALDRPKEFAVCDGSGVAIPGLSIGQQSRKKFGYTYQTQIGNDHSAEYGYKIHLIYGATTSPSEQSYTTVNDSSETVTFSWEIDTDAIPVEGRKPVSAITIDASKCDPDDLAQLADALYGTDTELAYLPLPAEVIAILGARPYDDLYPAEDLYP